MHSNFYEYNQACTTNWNFIEIQGFKILNEAKQKIEEMQVFFFNINTCTKIINSLVSYHVQGSFLGSVIGH